MLTFNGLLHSEGLDPRDVRLLRHQDHRMTAGWTTYALWQRNPDEFQRYERTQGGPKFGNASFVASFVVDRHGDVVFVGLKKINGVALNETEIRFEYLDEVNPPGTVHLYDLVPVEALRAYEGRLLIDWGPSPRSWVQRADLKDKPIIELRRPSSEEQWPGFMHIRLDQRDVMTLPAGWRDRLSDASGIYLLVCPHRGDQYVGLAHGQNGFYGRWEQYALTGHGGNKLLIERLERTQAPLQISILEVFGSAVTRREALAAEERWKSVLGSRAHGLNAN